MFKKKMWLLPVTAIFLIGATLTGCGSTAGNLTFDQLVAGAQKYNGKTVTMDAYYFGGFEISALAGSLETTDSGGWRIIPQQPLIWVEGGISQEIIDRLFKQTTTITGYTEYIGKLTVTGKFETGKFGHLDAYQYQMTVTKAEVLAWSPPPGLITTTGNLKVKITDSGGKPLQSAKVVSEEHPNGQLKVTGLTDADGQVVFNDIQAGDYKFYVSAANQVQTDFTATVTGGQGRTHRGIHVELRAQPAGVHRPALLAVAQHHGPVVGVAELGSQARRCLLARQTPQVDGPHKHAGHDLVG